MSIFNSVKVTYSKEEYLKRKKELLDIEYNPRKCEVCGLEEFEFISEKRAEELDEYDSDIEYYKCKKNHFSN
ncbi:hypothetical protein YTPLAS73_05060 [Nitrosarchaeum sp.]|nr:hypothetical protein YTPLAS73_05060 [Nitrosarchaeum sp.]